MKNAFIICVLFCITSSTVFSQHRCFTPELLSTPSSKDFLKKTGKRFSLIPKYTIKDTSSVQKFFVRSVFNQSRWDTVTAFRIFQHPKIILWLDSNSLKFFTQQELDSVTSLFLKTLLAKTFSNSIDSTKGILDLEHLYFGDPPNVDGDGTLDILLLDIKDSFQSSGSYIAGFFDPNDLTSNSNSNKRDVLYIDIHPLIKNENHFSVELAASTIAHEYQHLIHSHYEQGESEYTFINEGLSEFAEIACGFTPRSANAYIQNPQRSLLSWEYSNSLPDYARASLWTEYLFEQVGYQNIKAFVQSPKVGMDALNELLHASNTKTFSEFFTNWTLANFYNNTSLSKEFGYKHPQRKIVRLTSTVLMDSLPAFRTLTLSPSSCAVVMFPLTEFVSIEMNQLNREWTFSAMQQYANGKENYISSFTPNKFSFHATEYPHGSIFVLARNTSTPISEEDTTTSSITFLANGRTNSVSEIQKYDDGIADPFSNNASYMLVDSGKSVGVIFDSKTQTWLRGVFVKSIFLSEVFGTGVSPNAERDIEVQIFSVKNSVPNIAITQKRKWLFRRSAGVLGFEYISLNDDYAVLSAMKDSFCVVLSNDSDDTNYFGIGMDKGVQTFSVIQEKDSANNVLQWKSFSKIKIDTTVLSNWNAMIRAELISPNDYISSTSRFIVHYTSENISLKFGVSLPIDTLKSRCIIQYPDGKYSYGNVVKNIDNTVTAKFPYKKTGSHAFYVSLVTTDKRQIDTILFFNIAPTVLFEVGNNFPNPFNYSTSIPVTLWEKGVIVIRVYDLLGRNIFEKQVHGLTVGSHLIPIDFPRLASSCYFLHISLIDSHEIKSSVVRKIMLIK